MFNEILINKTNLINNIKQVKSKNQNSKICAMVKANAYGVGVKQVVKILENYVDFWGVACFFEANAIKNLTNKKILIVGPLENKNINERFSYTCSSIEDVKFLIKLNKKINIHIKINSGMNRYGLSDFKEFKQILKLVKNSQLEFEGIFTHFATADKFVNFQYNYFLKFVHIAKKYGFNPIVHADNSVVNEKFNHNLDMVRIGFDLYNKSSENFKPVVEIKSKIVQINKVKKGNLVGYNYRFVAKKSMQVAVIPIGYADGFDMHYLNLSLNISNKNCKILNICMDCFMLDVSDIKIKKGDEIYILNHIKPLSLYANYSNTSEYEVMTKFSKLRAVRKVIN